MSDPPRIAPARDDVPVEEVFPIAHRHRLALVVDLGWWFFGTWPLVIPYYLFKTQGRRALLPISAYLALCVVAAAVQWLISMAASRY